MSHSAPIVRAARPMERDRALYLFATASDQPPPVASFLLALRPQPIERIVATLAWWKEGDVIKFLLARQPGAPIDEIAAALVPALEAQPEVTGRSLEYGRLLAENEEPAPWLAAHAYEGIRTERVFEAPISVIRERVHALFSRHRSQFPPMWSVEAIRGHPAEVAWPLIEPYRLIRFDRLRAFWNAPGPSGYDPDFSSVLFDAGTPLGAFLVRQNSHCVAVDVRVVRPIPPRLRALANLALLGHIYLGDYPRTWRTAAFRGDRDEHRETANIARRMGGREVSCRHIYTRRVS